MFDPELMDREFYEDGCKFQALVLLLGSFDRVCIISEHDEFVGVNLLRRDGEFPEIKAAD